MKKKLILAGLLLWTLGAMPQISKASSIATADNSSQTSTDIRMNYKPITLDDIWANGTFAAQGITAIRSMNDGEHYCTLTRTGVEKYSYRTGERVETICSFAQIGRQASKAKPLPPIESYEFDQAEAQLLLSSGYEPIYRRSGVSDYYLYNIASGELKKISTTGKQRLTTFSPDGKKVAYVRDNNIYVYDIAADTERQLTSDGRLNHIINGTTDWVYEEEFAITRGFYWSPDSRRIAYYRFDESRVKEYNMQMWGALYPQDNRFKYPKAGEDNSVVDVYIADIEAGTTRKLDVGSERDQYIPRLKWTQNPTQLAIMRMNRLQNELEILLADATDGSLHTLYTETAKEYVEVPDTWLFLQDGKHFLINSERSGYNHIYMYDMNGALVRALTAGDYDVVAVRGVDEKSGRLFYTAHASSPINTELFAVNFNGKKLQKLSDKPGTYGATFSKGCKYYIRTFSDANTPPCYTLHDGKGKLIKVLQDNAALQQRMAEYGTGHKSFGKLTTATGVDINYYTVLPPDFDSTKRYPLFFYVYGGPGNQQVNNSYGGSDYYWFHMLAQQGYVVACFDGRGTGGRGAEFKKCTYKNLGKLECEDAIAVARWFGSQPWIDEQRIGIFGWSFGGYLSSLCILKGNDVFKSAIAVAPVTTWRYYDNIYTERFLQRPQDNPTGYDDNSPINFAANLKGHYLLIHGTGDDNVHFQNSIDLITALQKANKQFDFYLFPNKNHSIYGGNTRLHLYEKMTNFIRQNL